VAPPANLKGTVRSKANIIAQRMVMLPMREQRFETNEFKLVMFPKYLY